MALLYRILISFSLLLNLLNVSAQQPGDNKDNIYGLDPLLYNGRSYTYFLPPNTGGSQYLNDSQFEIGSVTIRGITFNNLALNYDILNQELILKYKTSLSGTSVIIISEAWLESFSLRDTNFELITSQDTLKRIYQVLGTGPDRILYHFAKDLELDNVQGSRKYSFTPAIKEMYLYRDGNIFKYRNNKIFYSLFDSSKRPALKEYLKKNKINVKKVSDKTMHELISWCNSL
jgi:hypothetical protein